MTLKSNCNTCHGFGMWSIGDPSPMGVLDANDGMSTIPCPECGANKNPISSPRPKTFMDLPKKEQAKIIDKTIESSNAKQKAFMEQSAEEEMVVRFTSRMESFITEFYFVHCRPDQRPDFKRLDDAEAWYKTNAIKRLAPVRNFTDIFCRSLVSDLATYRSKVIEEVIEKIQASKPAKFGSFMDQLGTVFLSDYIDSLCKELQALKLEVKKKNVK